MTRIGFIGAFVGLHLILTLIGCVRNTEIRAETGAGTSDALLRQQLREAAHRADVLSRIRLGASEKEITQAIQPLFLPVRTNHYSGKYPFSEMVPYTNRAVASEWKSQPRDSGNPVETVLGIFSDTTKTNLIDALSISQGHVEPVVDGIYKKKLFSLAKGDSIQRMYNELGRPRCEYGLDQDAKWHVRFLYFGLGGIVIDVDVDASEGRILHVSDATM